MDIMLEAMDNVPFVSRTEGLYILHDDWLFVGFGSLKTLRLRIPWRYKIDVSG